MVDFSKEPRPKRMRDGETLEAYDARLRVETGVAREEAEAQRALRQAVAEIESPSRRYGALADLAREEVRGHHHPREHGPDARTMSDAEYARAKARLLHGI